MKTEQKSVRANPFIDGVKVLNRQLTIFDQQDGKLVYGIMIEKTDFWFALQCIDGQVRKFDIGELPSNAFKSFSKSPARGTSRLKVLQLQK